MNNIPTLDDVSLRDALVLVRVDINAPVVGKKVLDAPRFSASALTIKHLLKQKARVVVIAHQGRKGDRDFLPLKQHAGLLRKHVGKTIRYIEDLFGEKSQKAINSLKNGEAILLENIRFYDDELDVENKNNRYLSFCKQFDVYVNDAFSVSHRAQGSIVLPPRVVASYVGKSFQRELEALSQFTFSAGKRTTLVLGGAKIEDYLPLLSLLQYPRVTLLASGVLGNLFLLAKGKSLGYESEWMKSQGYEKLLPQLKELLSKYGERIKLPSDFALGVPDAMKNKKRIEYSLDKAPFREKIWDVGHETIEQFKQVLASTDVVFMKGPLGFSEIKIYNYGTVSILNEVATLTKKKKLFSLLGGGHLTTTLDEYKIPQTFSYISLSGGALLQYLAGKELPGITAIQNSKK